MRAPDRRRFLSQSIVGAAALATPAWLRAEPRPPADGAPVPLPAPWAGPQDQEAYWGQVKEQFSLASGLILMNAANLCPSPHTVQEAVFRHTRDVDADASSGNRGKFERLREDGRSAVAAMMNVSPDEIALTRNTSESNNTVVGGVDLGAGDEVVLWEQNHPTNNVAWDVRADRRGFRVIRVKTPPSPASAAEIVGAFEAALSPRTRVLAFSHISNISGVALPAAELCALARDRGILTLIDGAQSFGALDVDLRAIGCDFYTASAHKWFVGPKEVGVLYTRDEQIPALWPRVVGSGWERAVESGARKFESMGQRDDGAVCAMVEAAAFREAIGAERIEARVRELTAALREAVRGRFPETRFHTPEGPHHSAGVLVFEIPGVDHGELYERLYAEHRIAGAPRGGEFGGIRFCPHIYNTLAEVERVVEAIEALAA